MKKTSIFPFLLCVILLYACQPASAPPEGGLSPTPTAPQAPPAGLSETQLQVAPDLQLGLYLDKNRWRVVQEPPEWLVEEAAEHLEHELAEQGKHPSAEEIETLARKRLNNNEFFIYKADSGAHLEVDASKLRSGESPPSALTVQRSAEYAGESLGSEEGVSGVSFETENIRIPGAKAASLLQASYKHHGEPLRFIGVIAFADPYWTFLYYTDPLKDPADYAEMETALRTFSIRTGSGSGN